MAEFTPPTLPPWLTIELEYECDDEAAACAIAYLITHPVSGSSLAGSPTRLPESTARVQSATALTGTPADPRPAGVPNTNEAADCA